jgi:acetyl/propionyl-CoA carboxylase alpha subunit
MAGAMSHSPSSDPRIFVVEPTASSRLPGDEARRIAATATSVEWRGRGRAVVRDEAGRVTAALVGGDTPAGPAHARIVEVLVCGWRFELEVEDAGRADLRERARRNRGTTTGTGGPLEIHAMIPGRVVAVAVAPGDVVAAGQTLLVVEAMKMQNELKSPKSGHVAELRAEAGATVNAGDVLVVVE